ncbi:ankyrin repeat domain-containing protein [Candidatus Bipolaricaulota bacterium]|nr:ankyrin repeat domain-containing protein [Candidatus Bipolaricaulota bacterium]
MPKDTTPTIWSAAKQADLSTIRTLLASDSAQALKLASDGCIPLHYAAFSGSEEAVTLLLNADADPHARSLVGFCPLHYAAFAGQMPSFRCLRAAGADVHALDDSRTSLLHAAASGGSLDIVEALLADGLHADTPNIYGELPAHRAAQANHLSVLQRLLECGKEANPTDHYNMTVQHKAAIGGAVDVLTWLLETGFDMSVVDIVGDSPLQVAAAVGRQPVVELLLQHGLSPNRTNLDHATALHAAAQAGHQAIAAQLLEAGASALATDTYQRTPLHLACLRGHREVVKLLLDAAPEAALLPDSFGHCPSDLAALYGRDKVWEDLNVLQTEAPATFSPADVRKLIQQPVGRGELLAWYLGHSGWAVRTQRHLFILDYAPGAPDEAGASLINGRINPAEWGDLTVFVLVSHHHADHFDQRILDWNHDNLRTVFGWDAPENLLGFRFTEQESKRIGDVVIASIPATDAGSAFLIEADGVSFYHAGDHAAGQVPPESAFTEGVEWLADQFAPIQAAFLPVFGCGLPSPDTLQAGNAFTIARLQPDAAFPMHIAWTGTFYRDFQHWAIDSKLPVGLGIADQPGDRFRIRNGAIEQIWI